MSSNLSVKVSSRYQIAVPRQAREQLNIKQGDRLLVDIQDGVMVLIPQPKDFAKHMAGLHREVWEGVDTTEYLQRERTSWTESING